MDPRRHNAEFGEKFIQQIGKFILIKLFPILFNKIQLLGDRKKSDMLFRNYHPKCVGQKGIKFN